MEIGQVATIFLKKNMWQNNNTKKTKHQSIWECTKSWILTSTSACVSFNMTSNIKRSIRSCWTCRVSKANQGTCFFSTLVMPSPLRITCPKDFHVLLGMPKMDLYPPHCLVLQSVFRPLFIPFLHVGLKKNEHSIPLMFGSYHMSCHKYGMGNGTWRLSAVRRVISTTWVQRWC